MLACRDWELWGISWSWTTKSVRSRALRPTLINQISHLLGIGGELLYGCKVILFRGKNIENHPELLSCQGSQSWVLLSKNTTRFSSKSCAFAASGNKLLCPIKWCNSSIWGLVQEQKTERIMIIFHNLPFYCFYHCTCSFTEQFGVFSFFICVNYFCNYLLQPFLQTQTVYICFFWYVGFEESKTLSI